MKLLLPSLDKLPSVAREFLEKTKGQKQFAFYGNMGVGKTTFIKEICSQLGVLQVVTSPTFAIINEYNTRDNQVVYHFDLYRINKIDELFDFGYEDYIYSSNYCFIEWPERAEEVIPNHVQKVTLSEMPDGGRVIEF
ncbi:MAG TPA: tRNA (adenosine(37)-N6)-threonylcarbamoyltransferase complex ATPase subunit type 1 TsaE [Bacteroidales bacterium]|jgi:ATPase, YjeE family